MYKLAGKTVRRLSDGACIPACEDNRDYQEYLRWCAEGNFPAPEFTEGELAAKAEAEERAQLIKDIAHIDRALLKLIIRMFQALAANGHISKADVGDAYINGALELRDKLALVEANE